MQRRPISWLRSRQAAYDEAHAARRRMPPSSAILVPVQEMVYAAQY